MSLLTSEKSFLTGRRSAVPPRLPEKHSQAFGQTERHESVWKTQEKIILGVLGEQEGSFLGTGRLRVATAHRPEPRWKPLQLKDWASECRTTPTQELLSTFRIGALYAGNLQGIVAA